MINNISKSDFLKLVEETLESGNDFSFTPTGTSMKPMLNGVTDTVILTKPPQKLKKYDVAFYLRRCDGALVLHRVVKVKKDIYTMCGDSQLSFEKNIHHDDVFAVLKTFEHNGKTVSVNSFMYKCYSRMILMMRYIRVFFHKVYSVIKK